MHAHRDALEHAYGGGDTSERELEERRKKGEKLVATDHATRRQSRKFWG